MQLVDANGHPVSSVPVDTHISEEVQKAVHDATGELFQRIERTIANSNISPSPEPKGFYSDPFQNLDSVGMGFRSNPSRITYKTLRQMTEQNTLVGSIVATRTAQLSSFCREQENRYSIGQLIRKRNKDQQYRRLTSGERDRQRKIEHYITHMGVEENITRDGLVNAMKKMTRDRLSYDQVNFEQTYTRGGQPYETMVLDASTIRIADQSKTNPRGVPLPKNAEKTHVMYAQLLNGEIVREFTPRECAFLIANPRSSLEIGGYGLPEPQILIQTVTAHLWAEEWNRKAFSQGSTIKGVLNMKGTIDRQKYTEFKRQWMAQVGGITNAWRTPIINSDGIEFMPMQMSNTEMGYQMWIEYLVKIACFTPEQRVRMADGRLKRIDRIEPGDFVRTHTGRARRVVNVQIKKVWEDVVNIRVGGRVIKATKEHPFFVSSSKIDGHTQRVFEDPDWTKAADIVEGTDYLVVPKSRDLDTSVKRIDLAKYVECKIEGDTIKLDSNRATSIPRFIELNEENAFVLGLYAAEGSATDYATTFSFAAGETDLASSVKLFADRFGLDVYDATQNPSSLVLRLNTGVLARAFKSLFGEKAKVRRVPDELRTCSLNAQRAFLAGLIAGDGWVSSSPRNAAMSYTTASRKMCDQVQSMFLAQNVYAGCYEQTRPGGFKPNSRYFDVRIHGAQLLKIDWLRGAKAERLRAVLSECGDRLKQQTYETPSTFLVPVSETWTEKYVGEVFNLEVEDEHTYVVEDFAVHNCAIYQIDPSEINFDLRGSAGGQQPVFMGNNEAQQKISKDRGLKPLLRFFEDGLNRHIVHRIDPEFELAFVGLDAKSEEQSIELRQKQGMTHTTINELRELDDLPPIPHGDIVANPTYVNYLSQKEAAEQQGGVAGGMPGQPPGQPGQGQEMEQPYDGRMGAQGDEQTDGAKAGQRNLQSIAGGKKPQDQGYEDDLDFRALRQNDWTSSVHASVRDNDLKKSLVDIFEIDL